MTFLKSLWADLIEKRLWPVAVVLLIALVAVPVFLGSGGEDSVDVAALGATGATGGLGGQAQVSLAEPGATRLDREGKLRDPFKQQAVPQGATGTAGALGTGPNGSVATSPGPSPIPTPGIPTPGSTATPGGNSTPDIGTPGSGSGSNGGGGSGGAGAGGGSAGGGGTTPRPDAKPSAPALSTYVTEIRFGRPGDSRPRRTVARLTPLPTVEQPFFVYLGVLTDRRTAVFLLSSDVKASGQIKCKPDKKICETIEMRAGQTAKLAVTNDDDSVTRYTLTVVEVRRRGTSSGSGTTTTADTKTASKGSSSDGDLGTDRYSYDDDTGLLRRVRAPKSGELGATLIGAEGASAIDLLRAGIPRGPAPPTVACRRC